MGSNKFDYGVADSLARSVTMLADQLEIKTGQMETRFGRLADSFRDEGYTSFETEMAAATKSVAEVISQLQVIANHVAVYAEKIKEADRG